MKPWMMNALMFVAGWAVAAFVYIDSTPVAK